jgi:hypothetical protein
MQFKTLATATLTAFFLSSITAVGSAQFWPGYGYGDGGYGGWGGAEVAQQADATMRNIAEQEHAASQAFAAQKSAAMQSNIRNTLSTQAEMRTQGILNQQQSNRDWWFQVQQQQQAQRRAMAAGGRPHAAETFVPTATISPGPSVATDIIPWPPVLWDSRFAQQRATVEAPYRRDGGKQATRTIADYESMIEAAGQMKLILGDMTSELSAQEYLHAEKFLDQLAAEARGRIEQK